MAEYPKKLIEVALPLGKINEASAREKSIRHGHPSTLHLWWARRPLACARAVIWASLVDDPSAHPDQFPTEEAQEKERERLFQILEELVVWENSNDQRVLEKAKAEIRASMGDEELKLLDPFAGGGAIPLEAQRLGLKAYAQDLNPVPVVINKAMIEIPPRFADLPPVNPDDRERLNVGNWAGHSGLAADVEHYGQWMRDRAFEKIGSLYPKVEVPAEQGGGERTVIAWLWARTVKCPNPACGCETPLVKSWDLSRKKGKEWHVEPHVHGDHVDFTVEEGKSDRPGTINRKGAVCVCCGAPIEYPYIREESREGRMGEQLMAVVAEANRSRVFVAPSILQSNAAQVPKPDDYPTGKLANYPGHLNTNIYGLDTFDKLFTNRQLTALTTFADLVADAQAQATSDAIAAGMSDDGKPLREGGTGATAYGQAVGVYLAIGIDRMADINNSLCSWKSTAVQTIHVFTRQAIPMIWDFAENNVFNGAAGDFCTGLNSVVKVLRGLPDGCLEATAKQWDARRDDGLRGVIVSTDPPYYDNIGYSDLSDFFYVWMRQSLRGFYPELFRRTVAPKSDELIASPYRHEDADDPQLAAKDFFEAGMLEAFKAIRLEARDDVPVTVYYAYKQSDSTSEGTASTGWETMLAAIIQAGFSVTGTWPMRSEMATRVLASDKNALASSIVLVLRKRPAKAPVTTRAKFLRALRDELRPAVRDLQASNLAPVDLAQSAIGPGMAVFSRYSQVLEADGSPMSVRAALAVINEELDVCLQEQGESLDRESRFCVDFYAQWGWNEAKYGEAQVLAQAKNVELDAFARTGVVTAAKGKAQLVPRESLPDLKPGENCLWEEAQQLVRAFQSGGVQGAADACRTIGERDAARCRELLYRLYTLCEARGWSKDAGPYNELVQAWPQVQEAAAATPAGTQGTLL